jgi:hypothetical protein
MVSYGKPNIDRGMNYLLAILAPFHMRAGMKAILAPFHMRAGMNDNADHAHG